MKQFLKITLLILITHSVNAQNSKSVEVRATKSIYIYKHTGPGDVIAIHRKNSISTDDFKTTKLYRLSYFLFTTDKPISKSIFQVFSKPRLEDLKSERLLVNTFLNRSGKITAIEYYLQPDSKITVKELEKLEDV